MNQSSDQSILSPKAIAMIATKPVLDDLKHFFQSLQVWSPICPTIYILCDTPVSKWLKEVNYPAPLHTFVDLDAFTDLTRQQMEQLPSTQGFPNLFYDFTVTKCDVFEKAFQTGSPDLQHGLLFCDADIFWLGPLPTIPSTATVGLSPHMIRQIDESKYGTYNAGFLWLKDMSLVPVWRKACRRSRFFEQAALEELVARTDGSNVHTFGPEHNYGWWRLYQSSLPIEQRKAEWTIKRDAQHRHSGLLVQGQPLSSIHTHWKTTDFTIREFNTWIRQKLNLLKSEPPVKRLLATL